MMMLRLLLLLAAASLAAAHTVITYPGWRGDNLKTTGDITTLDGLGAAFDISKGHNSSGLLYPYGMQWMYPCGGMPISHNRTKWPLGGGALSFQPAWFPGHSTAFIYVNIGLGSVPENYSNVLVPPFQLNGPTNERYPGTFCLMRVPLPSDLKPKVGDNATIQLILTAKHGAALYNCVDITFAEPQDVAEVNETNCFNSSTLSSKLIYEMDASQNTAAPMKPTLVTALLLAALTLWHTI